ncbi:MAG TPA: hypothetical protein VKN16_21545 [Methylomirabilota bacterium]|nr:hypothetical protein [Methylomirabilota bacterium]
MTAARREAVEAVRKRVETLVRDAMPLVEGTTYGDCYQRDTVLMAERLIPAVTEEIATLLRAYEAVVAERNFIAASRDLVQAGVNFVKDHANQLTALRAQHAAAEAVLDAALAWEKEQTGQLGWYERMSPDELDLHDAIRAYRAAKEGT